MAWGQAMGVLVRNIKTSHRDRTGFVHSSKKETHDLLTEYRGLLKDIAASNKAMAEDVKDFLSKSESSRKGEYKDLMEGIHLAIRKIQARTKEVRANGREVQENAREFMTGVKKEIKELAGDVKKFLADSEDTRKADFAATMKEVENTINSIVKRVESVRGEAKEMVKDYRAEHKEAAVHWASLPERQTATEEAAAEAEEPKPVHHKKK